MTGALVHFNGFPGVGKLTVARQLATLLPARLIDNHLFVDLAEAVDGRAPHIYPALLAELHTTVFAALVKAAPAGHLIFTNALAAELADDQTRYQSFAALAEKLGKQFVPVLLTCDLEENAARVHNIDRAAKGKLRDAQQLRQMRRDYTAYHPAHANAIHLDTTHLSPFDAATIIKERLDFLMPRA